jgi:hypothetical protein
MKTTNEIKQFFKSIGIIVQGNTSAGRGKWQSFRIPPDDNGSLHTTTYSAPPFPVEFRKLCIKTVYPNSQLCQSQQSAGNIGPYSIALFPHEWETVILQWTSIQQMQPTS